MAEPQLFDKIYYSWLERNGVRFLPHEPSMSDLEAVTFTARVDPVKLKAGIAELVGYADQCDGMPAVAERARSHKPCEPLWRRWWEGLTGR